MTSATLSKVGKDAMSQDRQQAERRKALSLALRRTAPRGVEGVLAQINPHGDTSHIHGSASHALLANYTGMPRQLTPQEKTTLCPTAPKDPLEGVAQDLNSADYRVFSKDFFRKAFGLQEGNLGEWTPERTRVCHRITRLLLHAKGMQFHYDDSLSEIKRLDIVRPTMKYDIDHCYAEYGHKLEKHIDNVAACRERTWYFAKQLHIDQSGLGFMPPPVPLEFISVNSDTGLIEVSPEYDPLRDELLSLWMDEIGLIIDHYALNQGIPCDDELGVRGLAGVLDRNLCRYTWPTLEAMCAWEEFFVAEIVKSIVAKGAMKTVQWLLYEQGYSKPEVKGYIKLANIMARELVERDQDEHRAYVLLRLEDMMEKAHENLDMKALNNAHKQMAMIMGLTRSEADDQMQDFMSTVKRVSATAAHDATTDVIEAAVDGKLLDMQ